MSETIDYRLLRVGEPKRPGDEFWALDIYDWHPVHASLLGERVRKNDPPIRRRTTLRDELAELVRELRDEARSLLDEPEYGGEQSGKHDGLTRAAESVDELLAKHYPQEPQS